MNIKRMPANYGDFGVDAASVEIVRDKKAPYLPIIKAKGGGGGESYDDTELRNRIGAIESKEASWNAKYNKPTGGIPKTDLASAVQTSLGKADSAIQADDLTAYAKKTDVPTRLSQLSDDTTHRVVTDAQKTTWNDKYTKPTSGIPKGDLSSAVQTSLERADSALQDAPIDGKQYARQDGEWTEVQSASGDAKAIGRACYNLFAKATYTEDVTALMSALWLLVGNTLTSISAVFTQGETVVYPSTALDSLKTMLVVTAHYDDGTTEIINDYTLSGTLAEGTSIITATYNDKTATFNVDVTVEPPAPVLDYISAVYTQSGEVYEDTALDDLKADLVVTAHMTDASTQTVDAADYTLSGTLTVGTSTVTVTYENKTTLFNVVVSEAPELPNYIEFVTVTPPSNTQSLTFETTQANIAFIDARCEDVTSDASDNVKLVYQWLRFVQPNYSGNTIKAGTLRYYKNDGTGDSSTYGWQNNPFTQNGSSVTIRSDRGPLFEGGKTYLITVIGDKAKEVS